VLIDPKVESFINSESLCTDKVGVECAVNQLDNNRFTNSGVVAVPYFFISLAR
jgi:hypothetical protein